MTLKELQKIARVHRMKQRHAQAWHEAHCEACKQRKGHGDEHPVRMLLASILATLDDGDAEPVQKGGRKPH